MKVWVCQTHILPQVRPNKKQEKNQINATLLCTIESKFVPVVLGKTEPKEIWDTLEHMHRSKCLASVHTLRSKLMTLKMGFGSSIRRFANEICAIENKHLFANHILSDYDKKFVSLNGLNNEFEIKRVVLQSNPSISFEDMVSSLEQTEDELQRNETSNREGKLIHTRFLSKSQGKSCNICEKRTCYEELLL